MTERNLAHHGGIERRGGLVEQDHLGLHRKASRDGDALALPARKLVREVVALLRQAHEPQEFDRLLLRLLARHPFEVDGSEREIVEGRRDGKTG